MEEDKNGQEQEDLKWFQVLIDDVTKERFMRYCKVNGFHKWKGFSEMVKAHCDYLGID